MNMFGNAERGFAVLAAVCLLGLLCRLRVSARYRRIMAQSERLEQSRDRRLSRLRVQAEELARLRHGIGSLSVYLRKSLGRYRIWGITLRGWSRFADFAAWLDLLGGAAMAFAAFRQGEEPVRCATMAAAGAGFAAVGLLFSVLADNRRKEEMTIVCLQDAFENRILPRLMRESRQDHWQAEGEPEPKSVPRREVPPVYTLKPEDEAILEEVFREYLP